MTSHWHAQATAAIVAVSTVGLAACGKPSTSPTAPATTGTTSTAQLAACAGTALFNTIPIDPAFFLAFRPLGFLSPPIHMFPAKHSAFSMTLPGSTALPVPVRAPGRVWVTEIWEATFSTGGRNYQLYVYPCTDVRVYFGHLVTLSDTLMAEMQKSPPSCNSFFDGTAVVTTCRHLNMSLMLEAGEQMGTGPDSAGVDFGLVDFRRAPASFVRLDHYDHFYPYWASPLDYFTGEARNQLASKTGHVFGTRMRTADPIGGAFMQDIDGTAQGNWFFPGVYHSTSTDLSPSIGLATDYVDPSQPMIAAGTTISGLSMGLYSFSVESSGLVNRAFRDVRPDGATYCYDRFLQGQSAGGLPLGRPNGVLLMTMPNGRTLQVQLVGGTSCATTPSVIGLGATISNGDLSLLYCHRTLT